MAFKMKGFSLFNKNGELRKLKKNLKTFQKQYKSNPNKDTKKDLDWARRALDEYYSGA